VKETVYVVNTTTLREYIPLIIKHIPATMLDKPVSSVFHEFVRIATSAISTAVGMPAVLRLPPPPSGDMPLGAYLARLMGTSVPTAQREAYVLL
jgi:hypothetical protein